MECGCAAQQAFEQGGSYATLQAAINAANKAQQAGLNEPQRSSLICCSSAWPASTSACGLASCSRACRNFSSSVVHNGQPITAEGAATLRASLMADPEYAKAAAGGDKEKLTELARLWSLERGVQAYDHRTPSAPPQDEIDVLLEDKQQSRFDQPGDREFVFSRII